MNTQSGNTRGNLSGPTGTAESETAQLMGRARVMMLISGLTTLLAIGAVVAVIGYRVFSGAGIGTAADDVVTLPKGAHIVSMAGSSGRVAVMVDVNGATEMRVFDLKTMKETGRLRFTTEP